MSSKFYRIANLFIPTERSNEWLDGCDLYIPETHAGYNPYGVDNEIGE